MKKFSAEILFVALAAFIVAGYIFLSRNNSHSEKLVEVEETQPVIKFAWGFPLNSVTIDSAKVRSNQNLSDILLPKGISAYTVDQLARNSKKTFDVRHIKAGNPYYLVRNDTSSIPRAMVYEQSLVDYVVFDLDSTTVYLGQKKVDTLTMTTSGTIETSLWNAFVDNGASPVLAVELADIFAWTIDFFGIRKGDQFKVIYDALYVDGKFAGLGIIHAANFINLNTPVSAYYFKNNDQAGYFDEEGNSLRKAFLKAPLSYKRISSRYSNGRMHPILKYVRPHKGVDYAAPSGTPVYSIGDGVVVKKAYQKGGGGNYINIKHNSVYTSQYMHLKGYAKGMAPGVRVKQGQLIALVGNTGESTGSHLHFEIRINGVPVDPLNGE